MTKEKEDPEIKAFKEAAQERKAKRNRNFRRHWSDANRKRYSAAELELIERAWAAGFFDGEGSVNSSMNGGPFDCAIEQVDVVSLERFRDAVDVGKIRPTIMYKGKPHQARKKWRVSKRSELEKVWGVIGPFLSPEKQHGFARALASFAKKKLSGSSD